MIRPGALCVALTPRKVDEVFSADLSGADCVEVRLDYLTNPEDSITARWDKLPIPVIATCRGKAQGGQFAGSIQDEIRILQYAVENGAQFVDIGKSAVSVLARPMVSPVVVDSVTVDVAAVSPTAVCGNVTVVALTLSAADGPAPPLLQAAQSIESKGHVKTKSTDEDLGTGVARSRRHATRCSSKTPVVDASAFSEQDGWSTRVSESFDVDPCTFLRRAVASVILSGEFFLR